MPIDDESSESRQGKPGWKSRTRSSLTTLDVTRISGAVSETERLKLEMRIVRRTLSVLARAKAPSSELRALRARIATIRAKIEDLPGSNTEVSVRDKKKAQSTRLEPSRIDQIARDRRRHRQVTLADIRSAISDGIDPRPLVRPGHEARLLREIGSVIGISSTEIENSLAPNPLIPASSFRHNNRDQIAALARLAINAQDLLTDLETDRTGPIVMPTWLKDWLYQYSFALDGKRPIDLFRTTDGIVAISRMLGAVRSGVYL